MLCIQPRFIYDKRYDVLYYKLTESDNSYGDEDEDNIVIMKDIDTDEVTGITIMNFLNLYKYNINKLDSIKRYIDINNVYKECRYK